MLKFIKPALILILFLILPKGEIMADALIVGVDANFRPFEFKNEKGAVHRL